MRTTPQALYVIILVIAGLAPPAAAQEAAVEPATPRAAAGDLDSRWLPWMGCWQLAEEQVARDTGQGAEFPERTVVCIAPADGGAGAQLEARGDGEVLMQRALVAGGMRHEVTEGDCGGWERRDWSADGRRLFTRAEIRCGTDPPRRMSGVSLLLNRSTWVDIQGITIEDRRHLEIRRYRPVQGGGEQDVGLPASPRDLRDARQAIAGPLTLAGVREAAAQLDSHVAEALLSESQPRLSLDSETLIELDDAGIDGGVIDLLVALAYPERFVVERRTSSSRGGGGWGTGWSGGGLGGVNAPFYYDSAMYGAYAPWGYGRYWYDPYWSRNGYGYGPGGGVRQAAPEPTSTTRAIDGLGYTRVQPRTAVARQGADDGGGSGGAGARNGNPRGGSSSGSSSNARSGGRSGAPRATPGGYTRSGAGGGGGARRGGSSSGGSSSSSGGSSSGGARRAVPRR